MQVPSSTAMQDHKPFPHYGAVIHAVSRIDRSPPRRALIKVNLHPDLYGTERARETNITTTPQNDGDTPTDSLEKEAIEDRRQTVRTRQWCTTCIE